MDGVHAAAMVEVGRRRAVADVLRLFASEDFNAQALVEGGEDLDRLVDDAEVVEHALVLSMLLQKSRRV